MPRSPHALVSSLLHLLALAVLLACSAITGAAQHTVVEKNGVGGRIETDYNAAGKATEMRTIGADGKLQQKVDYEYLAGYYVPQQTDTTYWPSGKVRRFARNTYDDTANFTGEFIQHFDESGKQIAGHKLTHDPWTGAYRCAEWSVAAQDYQSVNCPAGEEESGGAEEPRRFTYEEVMKNLEAARQSARRELQPETPVHPPIATTKQEVGLVLPTQLRPGERVSGSVVENPDQYSETPEVTVRRVAVPFESKGAASQSSGWLFESAGEEPRRADGPITFIVPRSGSELKITFREAGNPAHSVSRTLSFPANRRSTSKKEPHSPTSFQAPALCMKHELCTVSGPFSGDSSKTFAAFENRPATIVAETSDTAYLRVPELTDPGARPLFIEEGSKVVALPTVVGNFFIKNNGHEVQAGESMIAFPTLDGPGDIPDSEWQAGNFPVANLERARQLIPEFRLPLSRGSREPREKREASKKDEPREESKEKSVKEKRETEEKKKEGEILLVIKNVTPDQISLRKSKNGILVFRLSDEAFSRGEFKYDLLVEARKAGKVEVKGYVIPFLAPVAGQEFSVKPTR